MSQMFKNNDIGTELLEKKLGALAIESTINGVLFFVKDGSFGIVDINGHGQLTGSMEMLPILAEELKGLHEVYG